MKKLGLLVAALFLTACGGGGDEDLNPTSEGAASCSDVWVDGETLPEDYEGCSDGDQYIPGVHYECDSGTADLVTYEPEGSGFFTDEDGVIIEAGEDYANDPRYGPRFDDC